MADTLDRACELEQLARDTALEKQQIKQELPKTVNGDRVCIECEMTLSPLRVELVNAVRCFTCQSLHERQQKHYRG